MLLSIQGNLGVDSGQALFDLGDTGRAHQPVAHGQQLLTAARDRTRGVFLAYQAAGYLGQKASKPATAAATQAMLLARRIVAPRCTGLVEGIRPRFQAYFQEVVGG
ncbi:hypothetical protein ACGFS9_30590 [Streptomyces sp. NPDC048566]|uniref:hypothetical protein n=1 Tax=Streptomyces sp. NPDC048566 TaxID=3365569 RepID=UPI00371FA2FC